jgi:hypothetical protein
MLRPDAAACYHTPIQTLAETREAKGQRDPDVSGPTPPDPITRDFLAWHGEIIMDHINHERYLYQGKTFDCHWQSPNRGFPGRWWVDEVTTPRARNTRAPSPTEVIND